MSAADLRNDETKAIDAARTRAVKRAVAVERKRCANIARFAENFATTDVGAGVAKAIVEAIENFAIGSQPQGNDR